MKCKAGSTLQNGQTIECDKIDGHSGPHHQHGHFWTENHYGWPTTWTMSGLWLTAGGRIVKPGAGESCAENIGDQPIIDSEELQYGVKLDSFLLKLFRAVRKHEKSSNSSVFIFDVYDGPHKHYFKAIIDDEIVLFPFTNKKTMYRAIARISSGLTKAQDIMKP